MYSRSRRNVSVYIGMSVIGILLVGLYVLSMYNKKNIKKIRDSLDKQQKRMKYEGYPVYPEYNNVHQKIRPEDRFIYPDQTLVDHHQTVVVPGREQSVDDRYQTVVDHHQTVVDNHLEKPVDRRNQRYVPSLYQDTNDIPIFQTYARSSRNNVFPSSGYQRQS